MEDFENENLLTEEYITSLAKDLEVIDAKRRPLEKEYFKIASIIKRFYNGQNKTIGNVKVSCIKKKRHDFKKTFECLREIIDIEDIITTNSEESEFMTLTILKNKET